MSERERESERENDAKHRGKGSVACGICTMHESRANRGEFLAKMLAVFTHLTTLGRPEVFVPCLRIVAMPQRTDSPCRRTPLPPAFCLLPLAVPVIICIANMVLVGRTNNRAHKYFANCAQFVCVFISLYCARICKFEFASWHAYNNNKHNNNNTTQ